MARASGDVRMYTTQVLAIVGDVAEKSLLKLGHRIEASAKIQVTANDQIDTGFMRSAIYVSSLRGSTFAASRAEASSKTESRRTGRTVSVAQRMAPEQLPPERGTLVVAGANYSIFQELRNSFLYRAAEQEARHIGAILKGTFREEAR